MNKNLSYFLVNNIKINNIDKNRNIIDYLENLNIKIPHYCYHPKLSVSGNCRMCLVELKNSPKPLVSCAMTVTNKMEIYTDSPLVKKARENVLEFLLLNHPLDCPICDQGGECDLQDQSMVYGTSKKRFFNYKRGVVNKNLGPIVKTVMTRCIHCTRCVRFSSEIAGTGELGMFGRGYNSEIGTYVNKFLDSELSGNLIDVCPVGALTNKPYSFVDRSWELVNIQSLDFTNSFGSTISFSVKSNSTITKIQPFTNKQDTTTSWISDKTRFSFDSLFSPEKLSNITVKSANNKNFESTWEYILTEIINIIYFQNHLQNHSITTNKLIFILGNNLSIEIINILLLFQIKYPFIKINSLNESKQSIDLEQNIITESSNNVFKLNKSNFCLLIGINTRSESSLMNLKLRNRYIQGNFKIYSIGPVLDLTFPVKVIGSNINTVKKIVEGNHYICQNLIHSKNPLIIYNSEFFKNSTSNALLENLSKFVQTFTSEKISLNMVNSSLTESSSSYIGTLKKVSKKSFSDSSITYCLNTELDTELVKKTINLKLLNYILTSNIKPNYLINQNCLKTNLVLPLNFSATANLPSLSFVEESGNFFTTEGFLKKSLKVVSNKTIKKSNWEILRKIFSLLNSTFSLNNNNSIVLNLKNNTLFLNFLNLNYFSIQNFKNNKNVLAFKKGNLNLNIVPNKNNFKKKFFKSNILFWYNDFYTGNKNCYSKYSKVMIECSIKARLQNTNFKIIL